MIVFLCLCHHFSICTSEVPTTVIVCHHCIFMFVSSHLYLKCPPLSLSVIVLINHCILSVTSVVIFSSIYSSSLSVVKRPIIIVFLSFCHYFFIRISEVNHQSLSSMSVIVAINICHQYFICHQCCYHWCFLVSFYYSENAFEGTQHIYRAGGWWCDRHLSKEAGDPLEEAAAAP